MPITIDTTCTDVLPVEDFIAHVEGYVDLDSAESLSESAPQFRSMSNDVELIPRYFNATIKRFLDNAPLATYTPQSIFLGAGRGFFLRANIWTPLKLSSDFRSQEEKIFSYRNTHDHNFLFMTINHHGPGYKTDLYQYDPSKVIGYIGETIKLEPVGRTQLTAGRVMVYRKKTDVHTQFPPEKLSISLNLMVRRKDLTEEDQYFFDPVNRKIIEMPKIALIHKRASIIALAGRLANGETINIISSLIDKAPCRRIRQAALDAALKLKNVTDREKFLLIKQGSNDEDVAVRRHASMLLEMHFS